MISKTKTLTHILDLAEECTKGMDGYEQIAEWAKNALIDHDKGYEQCRCNKCGHIGWGVHGQKCGASGFCDGIFE